MISSPAMASPDFSLPFTIECDASETAVGAALLQTINDQQVVIAYASRSFTNSERNLSVTMKELLALIFSLEKFRCYIEGCKDLSVITDHASLIWLKNIENPQGKLARWLTRIQQFDFKLAYRPGKLNTLADFLSRSAPVNEINLLNVSLENLEPWYLNLRNKISNAPNKYPQWAIKEGFLYKHTGHKIPLKTNISEWKLVVPTAERVKILQTSHDVPTSAHLGFFKTFQKNAEDYYWPRMKQQVLNYIRQCETCQKQKMSNFSRFGLMEAEKKAYFSFEMIAVDCMGPFPRSKKGNAFLVVAVDIFSKLTIMKPLRQATASAIVSFLTDQVFLPYGTPRTLILDNAPAHTGKVFDDMVKRFKIPRKWLNCRYHPCFNPTERVNRTIGTAIRTFIKDSHKEWDVHIPEIQCALNNAVHESTKYSPNYLVFGRKVPILGNYLMNLILSRK